MERIRLDQHALKIQLPKQLLEHGSLMVFSCGVAGLSDRHTQGRRIHRYLQGLLEVIPTVVPFQVPSTPAESAALDVVG